MLYIGESINGTIPAVNQAILKHDADFILKLAATQVECGADYLDVNAGTGGIGNERDDLKWIIELLQDNVECPLCLDSSEPEILMETYENYRGKPMFNSVCDGKKLDIMAPAISGQECSVIALAHGEDGIPDNAELRFVFADKIIKRLRNANVKDCDIYIDPIIMSLSTNTGAGKVTLDTIKRIHEVYPEVNIILPISNIGFGIPKRKRINDTFAAMCIQNGANAFIADVRDKSFIGTTLAAEALLDKDRFCKRYIKAYKKGRIE